MKKSRSMFHLSGSYPRSHVKVFETFVTVEPAQEIEFARGWPGGRQSGSYFAKRDDE